jgi:hypothetical protein
MSKSPRIVTVPTRDTALAADARRIARRIPADLDADAGLAWYEAEMRRTYPHATVRPQDELARTDSSEIVWYVTNRAPIFRIDASVEVPLPRAVAYALYVDRVTDWQTAVNLTALSTTPEIVGNEYAARYDFLGHSYTGRFRVVSAEPPENVSLEAEGSGITVWYVTRFAPGREPASTRVSVKGDYRLPDNLLARIADRLFLERAIARDIERANETYRALCEAVARERRVSSPAGTHSSRG